MGVMVNPDEMHESPDMDIRDGLAEMGSTDLDYPYQAFRAALLNSGISDEEYEDVISALRAQIVLYQDDEREWAKKVYNA